MMSNAETEPDFWLSTAEGYGLAEPRACRVIAMVRTERRDDLALIEVKPPVVVGADRLGVVVIASRWAGESVHAIRSWPLGVHVASVAGPLPSPGEDVVAEIEVASLRVEAWAELHPTYEAAAEWSGWDPGGSDQVETG